LKPKHLTRISKFNVRTLNEHSQLPELVSTTIEHNIKVLSIQEHRFFYEDNLKHYILEQEWALITASAWKKLMNSTTG